MPHNRLELIVHIGHWRLYRCHYSSYGTGIDGDKDLGFQVLVRPQTVIDALGAAIGPWLAELICDIKPGEPHKRNTSELEEAARLVLGVIRCQLEYKPVFGLVGGVTGYGDTPEAAIEKLVDGVRRTAAVLVTPAAAADTPERRRKK